MRNSLWSDSGVRRLDFGKGGGGGGGGGGQAGRMEWVFGGALVAIIIGVIVLLVISQMGPGIDYDKNPTVHLQCVNPECNNELEKKFLDFSTEDREKLYAPMSPMAPGMERPPRLLCEKCGSIMGRQVQCPFEDCLKWYLDPMELNYAVMERRCTHCDRDASVYWQQKAQEQEQSKKKK